MGAGLHFLTPASGSAKPTRCGFYSRPLARRPPTREGSPVFVLRALLTWPGVFLGWLVEGFSALRGAVKQGGQAMCCRPGSMW